MRIILHLKKFTFLFFISLSLKGFTQSLSITTYTPAVTSPIDIKHGGDDRLFVAERAGKIRVINPDGTLRPSPFLDITSKIPSTAGEQGLLGLAMSPNFKTDRKFYVNYVTQTGGQVYSVIEEYKTSLVDSNIADVTALPLLTQLQPTGLNNHKGGNLMFGKDGYLYISLGDGGGAGDPLGNGQKDTTFLGKILRIDVSNSSPAQPYTIPPDNPFYGSADNKVKQEIWVYGIRNPFRCSIDRITGDAWIADVGQDDWEEINFEQYGAPRTPNYGWNITEGNHCYPPPITTCNMTGLKIPLYEYSHAVGHAITAGYVYRSAQSKLLFGMYIYADLIGQWIDGFRQNNGVAILPVQRLLTGQQVGKTPISFGEDRYGDLYILFNGDNAVYKIADTSSVRRPKAYFTPVAQGGSFLLQGLQGRNLTYQWLKNGVPVPGATSPDYLVNSAGTYKLVVTNTLTIRDTSDAFISSPLPVTLTSFTARRQSVNNVLLQWQTAQEENISGFTILRKLNAQTGFSALATIPGKGNGSSGTGFSYAFTDSTATDKSKIFYRIQIKNKDGSFTYSDVRIITGDNNKNYSIYPNPAKGQVTINLNNYTTPVQLIIYDYLGRKIKDQKLNQQINTIYLNNIRGVYTLTLVSDNGKNVNKEKLVVQ